MSARSTPPVPAPEAWLLGEGRLERLLRLLNHRRRASPPWPAEQVAREAWADLAADGGRVPAGAPAEALEAALGRPSWRLVVYGTLRPGGANAGQLRAVVGAWSRGILRGRRGRWGRYPTVTWDAQGEAIEVDILTSPDLPRHFPRLDRFEGPAYVRELVPVETEAGVLVGNVYAAAP